jgi:hypothetical protein
MHIVDPVPFGANSYASKKSLSKALSENLYFMMVVNPATVPAHTFAVPKFQHMNRLPKFTLVVCACLFMFCATASAQQPAKGSNTSDGGAASSLMKDGGEATVIVVGSAAKAGWAMTKFGAKYIAEPVAVKVALKIAITTLRTSGIAAKYLLPFAVKLSLL